MYNGTFPGRVIRWPASLWFTFCAPRTEDLMGCGSLVFQVRKWSIWPVGGARISAASSKRYHASHEWCCASQHSVQVFSFSLSGERNNTLLCTEEHSACNNRFHSGGFCSETNEHFEICICKAHLFTGCINNTFDIADKSVGGIFHRDVHRNLQMVIFFASVSMRQSAVLKRGNNFTATL